MNEQDNEPLVGPSVLDPKTTIIVAAGRKLTLAEAMKRNMVRVSSTLSGDIVGYQVVGTDEPGRPVQRVLWDGTVIRDN